MFVEIEGFWLENGVAISIIIAFVLLILIINASP